MQALNCLTSLRRHKNILIITYTDESVETVKLLFHSGGVVVSDKTVSEEIPPCAPLMVQSSSGGIVVPRLTIEGIILMGRSR